MTVHLNEYAYLDSVSEALSEALHNCNDGDTLYLGGGTIEIDRLCATPKFYYLPRYSDEKKYYSVYLENRRNITIDGEGATLIFDGDISPFGFESCFGITLKNFNIDYKMPFSVQALITEANSNYFEVTYCSDEYTVKYDALSRELYAVSAHSDYTLSLSSCLACEFDSDPYRIAEATPVYFLCTGEEHPVYKSMSVPVDTQELGRNRFRFTFKEKTNKHHRIGKYLVQADHSRKNTDFHFLRCENIRMENINMYASASFGVVTLLCKNISIDNVNSVVKPRSTRALAVNADVFHMVNTSGKIEITDCIMENNLDDSINIHSLLSVVRNKINKNTLLLDFTYLAKKALNLYRPDEHINILDKDTFECCGKLTVKSSEYMGDYCLRVEFKENVDGVKTDSLIESEDAKPEVYVCNCRSGNNRGRGFLLPVGRKTVVERCKFYNLSAGISVNGASLDYLEGSAVNGLVIRNNDFLSCAKHSSGFPILIKPLGTDGKRKTPYHNDIKILNNRFISNGKRFVMIKSAQNILISGNTYIFDKDQTAHDNCSDNGIELIDCVNADINSAFSNI